MIFTINDLKAKCSEFGLDLTHDAANGFLTYGELLRKWNEKMNLTAITEENEVMLKHFYDSLLIFKMYDIPKGAKVIDIGTGAGFPGLAMKIARPDLKVTLLDSLNKRLTFLKAVSESVGCEVELVHARAEEGSKTELRESFDIATARAVAALPTLTELCLPYVKKGGAFISLKGPSGAQEADDAAHAMELLGGKLSSVESYELPNGDGRAAVIIKKVSQTPPKYPRKNSEISKKPL